MLTTRNIPFGAIALTYPIGIMSADDPKYPPTRTNWKTTYNTEALEVRLSALGLRTIKTVGKYNGTSERTFIFERETGQQVYELGKEFGQEAVILALSPDKHLFLYTNGPNDGKYHPSLADYHVWQLNEGAPGDNWTLIPGFGYIRINFDWNTSYHNPLVL